MNLIYNILYLVKVTDSDERIVTYNHFSNSLVQELVLHLNQKILHYNELEINCRTTSFIISHQYPYNYTTSI